MKASAEKCLALLIISGSHDLVMDSIPHPSRSESWLAWTPRWTKSKIGTREKTPLESEGGQC